MTIDYRTGADVRAAAIELRKKHGALDWAVTIDQLIEVEGLDQGRYSPKRDTFSLAEFVRQSMKKRVQAIISLKEQVILLADNIHPSREGFAKGHELGHSTLPWHRDILYVCDEHDLSAGTRAQMEWEANQFSSEALLPGPLLEKVYEEFPTSMDTVLMLRSKSGASIESCAVTYANNHPRKCVMLIMEETRDDNQQKRLSVRKKVVSKPASKSALGTLLVDQHFGPGHTLFETSRQASSKAASCELELTGDKKYKCSVLDTNYRVLALVHE